MPVSRRRFLSTSAAAVSAGAVSPMVGQMPHAAVEPSLPASGGFGPWLEVHPAALAHNAREVARLAGGRPVLAVVKNNGYGLGLVDVARALEPLAEIVGFAVVKPAEAVALRDAGVGKPALLMGPADDAELAELVAREVQLATFWDGAARQLGALARRTGRPVRVHLYLDTGMSRMGMPWHRALPWIGELARAEGVRIGGAFTELAEADFDPTQLARFTELAERARASGVRLGAMHAASSHAVFLLPNAHLDLVRPGLVLYGAHPVEVPAAARAPLRPAFRLRARVVRVERIEAAEGVSYGRNWVATEPTWIATLPVGHTDGYPRGAVKGCEVLIGDRTYPVIGAVSAGHTIVQVGAERTVEVGDVATLVGPDHSAIHPNSIAERAGVSVYDVLMHLNPTLPRATWAM